MASPNLIRLGGVAAMLGGAMWVVKGGLIMLGGPDPDLFIPAQLFFALGLLGLRTRLAERGGRLGRIGGFLAYAAVALSMVNAPYSVFFAERGPQTPFPFNVTYFSASLAIFIGLVFLGIAVSRALGLFDAALVQWCSAYWIRCDAACGIVTGWVARACPVNRPGFC